VPNFETALAELEASSRRWRAASAVQESRAAYKRGAQLVAFCQTALKDAQQQIEILEKGVLKPFARTAGTMHPDIAFDVWSGERQRRIEEVLDRALTFGAGAAPLAEAMRMQYSAAASAVPAFAYAASN
jgi:exodeoxyribonuclease VII small subunit